MLSRSVPDFDSEPILVGSHLYYEKHEKSRKHQVYLRKPNVCQMQACKEQTILDVNQLFENSPAGQVTGLRIAPDESRLLLSVDFEGNGKNELITKDALSDNYTRLSTPGIYDFEWGQNSDTVYYTLADRGRPYALYRTTLEQPSKAELLFQDDDSNNFLGLKKSGASSIFLTIKNIDTSDVYWIDGADREASLKQVQPKQKGVLYDAYEVGEQFVIRTNENAPNYKLITRLKNNSGPWQVLFPESEAVILEQVYAFNEFTILFERKDGLPVLSVLSHKDQRRTSFFEPSYPFFIQALPNQNYTQKEFRFRISSILSPPKLMSFNNSSRQLAVIKRKAWPSEISQTSFSYHRVFGDSKDGTRVPISLFSRRDLKQDGTNPLLLYGYGAYGQSIDPKFEPELLSLLERGVIYAIAHVRGGGEYGAKWHDAGRVLNKNNSFYDFVATAKFLIAQGYTSKEKLVAHGRSAGGLLVARSAQIEPALFKALILDAPFIDVVDAVSNQERLLSERERTEWGDPTNPIELANIKRYSPFENSFNGNAPWIYVNLGLADTVLPPQKTLDWVERLTKNGMEQSKIFVNASRFAGHAGENNVYDGLEESAIKYTWMLNLVGQ